MLSHVVGERLTDQNKPVPFWQVLNGKREGRVGEPKIVVVDYHKGNLSSVVRGLARAGAAACTQLGEILQRAAQACALATCGISG